ncbi:hypothetical protein K443DRAFT_682401 [Laccaria amethystina LaAM-08-1]|uniref:Uncharacterized protein n=1 Tax=Laccaria amethystina LaAM-08-1 TaxID=1095629 RepID=A0A0C9XF77_9AGAR|nr:hypothetical protein K443DRAFT_682401 [Laccaria amethystina LaAM-08-1]
MVSIIGFKFLASINFGSARALEDLTSSSSVRCRVAQGSITFPAQDHRHPRSDEV